MAMVHGYFFSKELRLLFIVLFFFKMMSIDLVDLMLVDSPCMVDARGFTMHGRLAWANNKSGFVIARVF
jgi:hypothetical protein